VKMEVPLLMKTRSERARSNGRSRFRGNAIWIQEENSVPLNTVNTLPKEVMESREMEMNSKDSV